MEEDLDLILRWSIKDIYSEEEPPPRVWQRIRTRMREASRSQRQFLGWPQALGSALYRHLEEGVWQPPRPVRAYTSPRALLEIAQMGPVYHQKQILLVWWSLARALPNHLF